MCQCICFVLSCSLKYMEREWKSYVDEYTSSEILLSNCIAAAAFLTYCGAMGVDRRFVSYSRKKNKIKISRTTTVRKCNAVERYARFAVFFFFTMLGLVYVGFCFA